MARGLVYGDIMCFNDVAQLHAPTREHLATATHMLHALAQKIAREEGMG